MNMDPKFMENKNIEIIYDDYKPEKSEDGKICLRNSHLDQLPYDTLYHLALDTKKHDLQKMFGDVKFVCMGGTVRRMKEFAQLVANELKIDEPLIDLTETSDRYSLFKVGPVISVSHGMGASSLSILMHEIIKLVYYAKCTNVRFFRIGTSGGIGVEPGTIVLTEQAVDELFRPFWEWHILGRIVRRPTEFDKDLIEELKKIADEQQNSYETIVGKTMSAMDFYETQSRLDGAYCTYTETDKQHQLQKIIQAGIVNIEMEALVFGSMCRLCGIPGAVVNVTIINRMNVDQVKTSKEVMYEFQKRPQRLVLDFIKRQLQKSCINGN